MDDNRIILSVCIPTFNRAHLLRQTIEALFQSKIGNAVEIVISDNASSDDTRCMVEDMQTRSPGIKYFRNDTNIGLDANTLASIHRAAGEYCWLCSDDDIPLSGTIDRILSAIKTYSPNLIYLNYAGFLENERPEVVLERNNPAPDRIFDDPEEMLRSLKLNHFSATVIRREAVIPYFHLLDEYRQEGFTRGYSLVLSHYVILNHKQTKNVYLGAINVAVRNPFDSDYDPSTTIIDTARHYERLLKYNLISRQTVRSVLKETMRMSYRGILPTRCTGDRWNNTERQNELKKLHVKYDRAYYYLFPYFLLHLPRWALIAPYFFGRKIKQVLRKLLNRSPV